MKRTFLFLLFLTLILTAVLTACGRSEETPEVLPTLAPAVQQPTAVPTIAPTEVPQLDADSIDWPPQLVMTEPPAGAFLPLDAPLTIRFDQPMNQQSVEDAFGLTTAVSNQAISGTFSWPRADTLLFTPSNPLMTAQRYQVQVNDTAVSQNGLPLQYPIQLELETVGPLQVSQVVPAPDTTAVLADSPITLFFNHPVVPLTSTNNQDNLPQPIQISPPLEGEGAWLSTSIYQYTPRTALAGATTYTISVDPSLTDLLGTGLDGSFSWQFSTVAPALLTIDPADGDMLVRADAPLTLTFNMPMATKTTQDAIQLTGGAVPDFEYEWSDDGRILTMTPQEPLDLGTSYQLTVGQGAEAANGGVGLAETAVTTFQTVPLPAVLGTTPSRGATAERFQRGVVIRFASPMDLETLEGQIFISPEPEGPVNYFFNEFSNELIIDFAFPPSTRFVVTVPRSAADPYGNTLGDSYEFVFTTAPRAPVASFNMPRHIAQLSTSLVSRVEIVHVNVSDADVALYDLGLPLGLLTRPFEVTEYRPAAQPLRTWELDLEGEEDVAGVTGLRLAGDGVLPTGIYMLTVETDETAVAETAFWQNQRQLLVVADSNIVVKEMLGRTHVWVTDIRSGQPAANVNLTLYDEQGIPSGTAVTDSSGWASFETQSSNNFLNGVTVIANQPGQAGFGVGSSQWDSGAAVWQFELPVSLNPEQETFAYLYTDRPIYRPGDTIFFKGIVRQSDYGRYTLPTPRSLSINLRFNGFFEGQEFNTQQEVTLDENGTLSGQFELPDDLPLGNYGLNIEAQNLFASHTVTITEYRRPEFFVEFKTAQTERLRGEAVTVDGQASFFFGGSASNLPLTWRVTTEPFFFTPEGPFFSYTDNSIIGEPFFGQQELLSGEGMTDENGRFQITLPPDLLDELEAGSQRVIVEATVTDLSNQAISGRLPITFHAAELYVGITTDNPILLAGQSGMVEVQTVDWEGTAVPNHTVDVTFYERTWRAIREEGPGGTMTRWEADDTEVASQMVTTDGSGAATASFTPESGGSYVAIATVQDDTGRTHQSSTSFWVADDGRINWQIDPRDNRLNLEVDQRSYAVGDTAQILVQSPFETAVQAWLTIERGDTLLNQQLITLSGSSDVLSIPIEADYTPNVFVSVTAVKPVTPDSGDPEAQIRLGIAELVVEPTDLLLNVEIRPQDDQLEPGETAVINILTTDTDGNPVAADLSLALADKAVLSLREDSAQPISEAFYARQPLRSRMGSGLFISGENVPVELPTEAGGFGGGGGGAEVANEAVALRDGEEGDDARSEFPDTAYWQANIQTDVSGQASVSIELPDTLTTWVFLSKAATEDTRVGETQAELITALPLLIRPVTPRFFTVGDVVQLGAIVNNNTSEVLETAVTLEAGGVSLQSDAVQTVTVPANGQALVQWQVAVLDETAVDLTFRAEGGEFVDVTKPSFGVGEDNLIPIYRYTATDVVGTAGVLTEAGRQVEAVLLPDTAVEGTLNVQLETSLVGTLFAVVEELAAEPARTSCPASLADALLPRLVALTATLATDTPSTVDPTELEALITQLTQLQNGDGGWGWCGGSESDPFFTANVVMTLWEAEQLGLRVPNEVLVTAVSYLQSTLTPADGLTDPQAINQQIYSLYAISLVQKADIDLLLSHFDAHFEQLLPESRALMGLMLHRDGSADEVVQSLVEALGATAVLSATGAHWEADAGWVSLRSDVRNTAVVLLALSEIDPSSELLVPTVRWLMTARQAVRWATPHETAWVTLALLRWGSITNSLGADFSYRVSVDLAQRLEAEADGEEPKLLTLSLDELSSEEVHFVELERQAGPGNLYYTLYLDAALDAGTVTAVDRGVQISRTYFDAECDPAEERCEPITQIEAGQQVRVELTLTVANDMLYAIIDDPIPAGTEALNPNLETTSLQFDANAAQPTSFERGYWGYWFFNQIEFRDERVTFLSDFLPAGTYQYTYFLQATLPGTYQVMPTFARQQFMPEVNGRSAGQMFVITSE